MHTSPSCDKHSSEKFIGLINNVSVIGWRMYIIQYFINISVKPELKYCVSYLVFRLSPGTVIKISLGW
jgi:hypothetical protein